MYFSNIPKILYQDRNTDTYKLVTNLLRRVKIRAKVKENAVLLDTYDVKDGETPEIIAHKYYGDSEYHWIVLLVNDITDVYHQWPMRYSQFLQFVNDKYSDPYGVHHYEIAQSSGDTTKTIEVYNNSALYTGDTDFYSNATTITNIEYEENLQNDRRKIRLLDPRYVPQFVEEFEELLKETAI